MNVWILYDGRAELGDTDDASIMEAMTSRRQVKDALHTWHGADGVLVEYDSQTVEGRPDILVNERKIGHLREGKALLARLARS